jgi:hypothetical protein
LIRALVIYQANVIYIYIYIYNDVIWEIENVTRDGCFSSHESLFFFFFTPLWVIDTKRWSISQILNSRWYALNFVTQLWKMKWRPGIKNERKYIYITCRNFNKKFIYKKNDVNVIILWYFVLYPSSLTLLISIL